MMMGFMALPTGAPTNEFYESWADYLQPYPTIFLKMAAILGHWIAVLFYNLGAAVLDAWNAAWKLADFSSLFTSKHGDTMTGFQLTQYIGVFFMIGLIIMSIMMAIQIMQFTMTSGRRGKEWPAGVVTALIVIWIVPLLISGGTSVAKAMNSTMLGSETQQNVLTKIWRSNTVDLTKLANANFDVHGGNPNQYSPITDDSKNDVVKTTAFTDVLDEYNRKALIPEVSKRHVFEQKYGSKDKQKLDEGSYLTKAAAAEVYPRVKTNWFGIIAAEIVFAIVGFVAITELLVRFYRLAYYSLTLLVFAFRDMEGKKAMQILHVMEGSIIGVAILPLNLLMFFGFTQWGVSTIGDLNIGWAPYTILVIALMIAGMKGLMGGFALIDDWTGVPTGLGATVTGMVGAAATAAGVARGVTETGKAVGSTVKNAGTNLRDKVTQAGEKAAKMREAVNQAGENSGLMPNKPMPMRHSDAESTLPGMNSVAPNSPSENKSNGLPNQFAQPATPNQTQESDVKSESPANNNAGSPMNAPYPTDTNKPEGDNAPSSLSAPYPTDTNKSEGDEVPSSLNVPYPTDGDMPQGPVVPLGNSPKSDAPNPGTPGSNGATRGLNLNNAMSSQPTQGNQQNKLGDTGVAPMPNRPAQPNDGHGISQPNMRDLPQGAPSVPGGNKTTGSATSERTVTNSTLSGQQQPTQPVSTAKPASTAQPKPVTPTGRTNSGSAFEQAKAWTKRNAHVTRAGGNAARQ
ncbi:hypothetical protein EFL69_06495 [Weissella confusa]|uniref:pLS20_p028 family conjugation system transmembrane protein n=1 Tax=Weissella confusa TaxID=1583 RepID=UPI00223BFBA1|nr:hypothetical protein [Weissella confusa]MCS9992728.1 hypothetical protein [Weissella confusa]